MTAPVTAKAMRKALAASPPAANSETRPPPIVTPRPMASICTMEKRLLPLPASRGGRPLSVTPFMAANCMELLAPKRQSTAISSHRGVTGEKVAKAAMDAPTMTVFQIRKRV